MGFFKTKTSVGPFLKQKWNVIMSPDRDPVWEKLRAACGDRALNEVPTPTYFLHLGAIYLQLLGVAVARTQAPMESVQFSIEQIQLRQLVPGLDDACTAYNRAFGASSSDGIRAIVDQFSRAVAADELAAATKERIYEELVAMTAAMFEELKGIRFTS